VIRFSEPFDALSKRSDASNEKPWVADAALTYILQALHVPATLLRLIILVSAKSKDAVYLGRNSASIGKSASLEAAFNHCDSLLSRTFWTCKETDGETAQSLNTAIPLRYPNVLLGLKVFVLRSSTSFRVGQSPSVPQEDLMSFSERFKVNHISSTSP
jgi:hypothetical protein